MPNVEHSLPLGKPTRYQDQYDPSLLCPFPRQIKRDDIGIAGQLPFDGFDVWTAYEVSWLNPKGKPVVALGEFSFPCTTPYLIESKSFKLYLNSYNQTPFADECAVVSRMTGDLSRVSGGKVDVRLFSVHTESFRVKALPGICLDELDIEVENYLFDANLLAGATESSRYVAEELHSHLLKSNCLVTNQPDWGSVLIRYQGAQIDHEALLRYLISFRRHNEFHEQCVERIFADLMRFCRPEKLTVYARYTRRGGLDINPFRSNFEQDVPRIRLVRQ